MATYVIGQRIADNEMYLMHNNELFYRADDGVRLLLKDVAAYDTHEQAVKQLNKVKYEYQVDDAILLRLKVEGEKEDIVWYDIVG